MLAASTSAIATIYSVAYSASSLELLPENWNTAKYFIINIYKRKKRFWLCGMAWTLYTDISDLGYNCIDITKSLIPKVTHDQF